MSYRSEAELYNDYSIQPLKQTLEELIEEFEGSTLLKAVVDGRIIGSVRARLNERSICQIGKLIVHPLFQNQGIGTQLMMRIEDSYRGIKLFELFTGLKSEKNLHLYTRLGYKPYKSEQINNNLTLIYMYKNREV